MLHSFSPERGSDLSHPRCDSIVGLSELFLFLVTFFKIVVFGDDDLGGAIELASEL